MDCSNRVTTAAPQGDAQLTTDRGHAIHPHDFIPPQCRTADGHLVQPIRIGEGKFGRNARDITGNDPCADADVLDFFRNTGKRYQTRINAVLRSYVEAHKTGAL
ncbi:BrnA antitoxin family protein [Xylella fastidiosa subsp. pauca]|nr:BrnA antitoxin family protein [Xylella fastidiosa]MDG5825116.1 BrnA antitoxin family protein [Xylella fastidiosa subsp. pauca]